MKENNKNNNKKKKKTNIATTTLMIATRTTRTMPASSSFSPLVKTERRVRLLRSSCSSSSRSSSSSCRRRRHDDRRCHHHHGDHPFFIAAATTTRRILLHSIVLMLVFLIATTTREQQQQRYFSMMTTTTTTTTTGVGGVLAFSSSTMSTISIKSTSRTTRRRTDTTTTTAAAPILSLVPLLTRTTAISMGGSRIRTRRLQEAQLSLLLLWSSAFRYGEQENDDNDNDNEDDDETPVSDELAKLMGRRNMLKRTRQDRDAESESEARQKQQQQQEQQEQMDDNGNDPSSTTMIDLDLDKLPSFTVERSGSREYDMLGTNPELARFMKQREEKERIKRKNEKPTIIDYQSEYDDENELHITNRIGISTIGWGNPRYNFVSSGKLTKRMIKQGKYVPGDIVLAYNALLDGGITFFESSSSYGIQSKKQQLSAYDIIRKCILQQQVNNKEDSDRDRISNRLEPSIIETYVPTSPINKIFGTSSNTMGDQLDKTMDHINGSNSDNSSSSNNSNKTKKNNNDSVVMMNVELYQAPKPLIPIRFIPGGINRLVDGLISCIKSGQCNYVGVQNIQSTSTISKISKLLLEKGGDNDISLTSNTINNFSLSKIASSGKRGQRILENTEHMISICKKLGIIPIVTDPLDGGIVTGLSTGIYTATNPNGGGSTVGGSMVSGKQQPYSFQRLEKLQPLHSVQETLTKQIRTRLRREQRNNNNNDNKSNRKKRDPNHQLPPINTDVTTTQIAINYVISKGAVPIISVNTPKQADEVLGCLGWSLTTDEISMLESAAAVCRIGG